MAAPPAGNRIACPLSSPCPPPLSARPEASLAELGPLVTTLRHKVARVDGEILAAVRQQASSGSRARTDLAAARATIEELFSKIHEIQRKAEQSELMVQVGPGVLPQRGGRRRLRVRCVATAVAPLCLHPQPAPAPRRDLLLTHSPRLL